MSEITNQCNQAYSAYHRKINHGMNRFPSVADQFAVFSNIYDSDAGLADSFLDIMSSKDGTAWNNNTRLFRYKFDPNSGELRKLVANVGDYVRDDRSNLEAIRESAENRLTDYEEGRPLKVLAQEKILNELISLAETEVEEGTETKPANDFLIKYLNFLASNPELAKEHKPQIRSIVKSEYLSDSTKSKAIEIVGNLSSSKPDAFFYGCSENKITDLKDFDTAVDLIFSKPSADELMQKINSKEVDKELLLEIINKASSSSSSSLSTLSTNEDIASAISGILNSNNLQGTKESITEQRAKKVNDAIQSTFDNLDSMDGDNDDKISNTNLRHLMRQSLVSFFPDIPGDNDSEKANAFNIFIDLEDDGAISQEDITKMLNDYNAISVNEPKAADAVSSTSTSNPSEPPREAPSAAASRPRSVISDDERFLNAVHQRVIAIKSHSDALKLDGASLLIRSQLEYHFRNPILGEDHRNALIHACMAENGVNLFQIIKDEFQSQIGSEMEAQYVNQFVQKYIETKMGGAIENLAKSVRAEHRSSHVPAAYPEYPGSVNYNRAGSTSRGYVTSSFAPALSRNYSGYQSQYQSGYNYSGYSPYGYSRGSTAHVSDYLGSGNDGFDYFSPNYDNDYWSQGNGSWY